MSSKRAILFRSKTQNLPVLASSEWVVFYAIRLRCVAIVVLMFVFYKVTCSRVQRSSAAPVTGAAVVVARGCR